MYIHEGPYGLLDGIWDVLKSIYSRGSRRADVAYGGLGI